MPFRDNSTLIRTAGTVNVEANGASGDVYSGADGSTAFVIANGSVGDDLLEDFGDDDSLITFRQIFDGNNDGFIAFGPNGVLDVDRFGGGNSRAGEDQLQLVSGGADLAEIRYLGAKDGRFAYADSATLRDLAAAFGDTNFASDTNAGTNVVEGTVGDDTFNFGGGANVLLQDNLLGLNLGGDIINGFGDDDLLVTTALLFDSTGEDTVSFSTNRVLDISGANGPQGSDPTTGPGGQLDFNAPDEQSVTYLGSNVINGKTYYYYGTDTSTVNPFEDA